MTGWGTQDPGVPVLISPRSQWASPRQISPITILIAQERALRLPEAVLHTDASPAASGAGATTRIDPAGISTGARLARTNAVFPRPRGHGPAMVIRLPMAQAVPSGLYARSNPRRVLKMYAGKGWRPIRHLEDGVPLY